MVFLYISFHKNILFKNLHQFSFNVPQEGAEMNGLERLLCASSMRKGVNCILINIFI